MIRLLVIILCLGGCAHCQPPEPTPAEIAKASALGAASMNDPERR